MAPLGSISRRELIRALRAAGFSGPFVGTKHAVRERGNQRVRIPNPHRGDIGPELLRRILRQAGISAEDWQAL